MKQFVVAFDLDGTLIDSEHRCNQWGDNSKGVDVQYWIENSTRERIFQDSLLPLVEMYYEFKKTNYTLIAVTAREMTVHDMDFLEHHGIDFKMVLHRGDNRELDHIIKEKKLNELFESGEYIPFLAFDDKEENLEVFKKFGFRTFNAAKLNTVKLIAIFFISD